MKTERKFARNHGFTGTKCYKCGSRLTKKFIHTDGTDGKKCEVCGARSRTVRN